MLRRWREKLCVRDFGEALRCAQARTPGRRRSDDINRSGAKKPGTRVARIAKFRDRILAGKGASER